MPNEIYTITQVAEYLKISDKTVRRLIDKKELLASKVGKSWRITHEDVDRYLKDNKNREI